MPYHLATPQYLVRYYIFHGIKAIINKQTKIDILVNNAGTNIPEHFTKVKRKNMEFLVKVNTIAAFNIAQLCTLKMIQAKSRKKIGGSIVNMSSQMGHVGGPIRSVYNMTKFGIEGFTDSLRRELIPKGINVCLIEAGIVHTKFFEKIITIVM